MLSSYSSSFPSSIGKALRDAKQSRISALSEMKKREASKIEGSAESLLKKEEKALTTSSKKKIFGSIGKEGSLFKLPSESSILTKALMIFFGLLLIVQGVFSVRTYEKRTTPDVKPAVIRSYDAASFFVGTGVGLILHQALNFLDFKFVDKLFVYILILGIAVYAGYVTNRMNLISNESDAKNAQKIALTAESYSLGMIGVAVGIVLSFTFITISKFVTEGPAVLYVEVAGVVVGGLFVAAACANQFYLYDNTGKSYKTALIISIIIFILTVLAIIGAIVLAFFV